jgi:putative ABC transport system substrate-binding protein
MRRRDFIIATTASATAARPPVAHSQPRPVIGYLDSASLERTRVAAFRQGLSEAGFNDGQNVEVELRAAGGRYETLPALAAELINRPVNLILGGGLPATRAAKAATATIPIVFVMGADPVKLGIVPSLNRPGGNITGICQLFGGLGAKRLELVRDLIPGAALVAILTNPQNPNAEAHLDELTTAARVVGQRTEVFHASTSAGIEAAFDRIAARRASAVVLADDPLFTARHEPLVALAARHAVPTIYYSQEFTNAGGLISYGSNVANNYRLAGGYAARILKGTKPADLPVLLPTTFDISINLKAAKALGLEVPPTLLGRADQVIE